MNQSLMKFYTDNKKFWPGLITVLIISLSAGIFKMCTSIAWGRTVDFGITGNVDAMLKMAIIMGGSVFLDCLRTSILYYVIGRVTEGMFFSVREKAFGKITRGDTANLEALFQSGDTATRLNNDIDELSNFAAGHVSNFSRLIFQGFFAVLGCSLLCWQLSIVYLVVLPISLWIVGKISNPIYTRTKKSMDSRGKAMNLVADVLLGLHSIKCFQAENCYINRFRDTLMEDYAQSVDVERISTKMTSVKYLTNVLQTMMIFLFGAILVSLKIITVGTMISFITLSNYISEPIEQMDYMVKTIRQAAAASKRLYEIIDIPDESDGLNVVEKSDDPVEVIGVSYGYNKNIKVLNNIAMHVRSNQHVAIVGESGCGKSTLLKLFCRFILPDKGAVKLFGVDSRDWNLEALRNKISMVTQEMYLFDGSIYENIAYGACGVTRETCIEALKNVDMWNDVLTYSDGIDHQIGEFGSQLSGGQKQRICIARAMVRQSNLVLLDEVTSALDSKTEKDVQSAIDKLLVGRTAIIVTHRLSTIKNVDYIYVMHEGRVLEEGSYEQLLRKKGAFYRMYVEQGLSEASV